MIHYSFQVTAGDPASVRPPCPASATGLSRVAGVVFVLWRNTNTDSKYTRTMAKQNCDTCSASDLHWIRYAILALEGPTLLVRLLATGWITSLYKWVAKYCTARASNAATRINVTFWAVHHSLIDGFVCFRDDTLSVGFDLGDGDRSAGGGGGGAD